MKFLFQNQYNFQQQNFKRWHQTDSVFILNECRFDFIWFFSFLSFCLLVDLCNVHHLVGSRHCVEIERNPYKWINISADNKSVGFN